MSFILNCNSDVLAAISREAKTAGISQTRYINRLLEKVVQMPKVLTSGTSLDELEAQLRLFSDDVLEEISVIAQAERRSAEQMLLYLAEIALAVRSSNVGRSENSARLGLLIPLRKKEG